MMMMGFRCAVLWLLVSAVTLSSQQSFSEEEMIAQSESGPLRAAEMASSDGRPFLAFLGVPYAEPPVGQLRFQVASSLNRSAVGVLYIMYASRAGS